VGGLGRGILTDFHLNAGTGGFVCDLRRAAVISSSTYSSPQFAQTLAGTPLKTNVAPFFSRVTVVLPTLVSPFLQTTHFKVCFSVVMSIRDLRRFFYLDCRRKPYA